MSTWYHAHLVATGRSATLWALVGFVAAYAMTRGITRRIRSRRAGGDQTPGGPVRDVYIGGVHIHHQVWGMLLVMVTGFLDLRFSPGPPTREIIGFAFGVGAALVLDEFALWIHLEDVYWTEDGRKSIDAVVIAVMFGLALLIGTSPIGIETGTAAQTGYAIVVVVVVVHISLTVICMLKGKLATGLIGLPIPFLSLIGAIRLAKPSSFWAQRFYGERRRLKSAARFDGDYDARHERIRDVLSGGRW